MIKDTQVTPSIKKNTVLKGAWEMQWSNKSRETLRYIRAKHTSRNMHQILNNERKGNAPTQEDRDWTRRLISKMQNVGTNNGGADLVCSYFLMIFNSPPKFNMNCCQET